MIAKALPCVVLAGLVQPHAHAAITVDGTRDAAYGSAVAVQTVNTAFGDANAANGLGGGGELDAAFTAVEDGRLFVMLTGNIENNFNKLGVFFDTKAGGENTLSATPQYDFENISQNLGGLTFDAGFTADYHLYARWGDFSGNVFTVDIVDRMGGTSAAVPGNGAAADVGTGTGIQSGVIDPADAGLGSTGVGETRNLTPFLTQPVAFGFNNTNTDGVTGGTGAADQTAALAVTTGFEFSIDLADLGSPAPGSTIKLHAVYGNSNNNFHSNQTLGGLAAGTANLGGDGGGNFTGTLSGVDFGALPGDQFFSVLIPEANALVGDYNADGFVSQGDLDLVLLNWGDAVAPAGFDEDALPGGGPFDGLVSQNELDGVLLNWGNGTPAAGNVNAIPEPTTLVLIGAGLLAGPRRRRA